MMLAGGILLPKNKIAMSCAILMINDQERRDYFDNFVPFVIESIRKSTSNVISATEIQKDLLSDFGISLPITVISTILKRKLKPKEYIKVESRNYIPNRERLNTNQFDTLRLKVLEQHEKFISNLKYFVNQKYGEDWDDNESELTLESFLEKNNLLLTRDETYSQIPPKVSRHFILADFINSLEAGSVVFAYLESIVRGSALADAIYYAEPSQIDMKFKSTEIYFDTTFIIYALGYAGEAKKAPCIELLDLIKNLGGARRCFKHTVHEIIGILDGCKNRLSNGQLLVDNHGTLDHFVKMRYTPSDVERIIFGLENEIEKKLKIRIVEKPPYDGGYQGYNIDEQGLKLKLLEEIRYNNEAALTKDIDSVSAIMRLRKLNSSIFIENCKAVFITTNRSLAEVTKKFFSFGNQNSRIVPPVLSDYVLTNLLWLKSPSKAPDLTRKRIIADCYAALLPDEHIWKKYIEKASSLLKEDKITADEYYILRSAPEARVSLMEVTQGDEDVITIGSIEEILQKAKEAMVTDVVKDYEYKIQKIEKESQLKQQENEAAKEEIEKARNEAAAAISRKDEYIKRTARIKSKRCVKILKIFIVSLLILGQSYSFFMLELNLPIWLNILIFFFFIIYFPVSGFFGFSLNRPFLILEEKLYGHIKNTLEIEMNLE